MSEKVAFPIGAFDGMNRVLEDYARLQMEAMRETEVRWYRMTHGGQMPPDRIRFGWYSDLWPWSVLRPVHLSARAKWAALRYRVQEVVQVARHGIPERDCA